MSDFSSGHDLTVGEFEPHLELCTDSTELAWDSLSPSLSAPPPLGLIFSLSLPQNKEIKLYKITCINNMLFRNACTIKSYF